MGTRLDQCKPFRLITLLILNSRLTPQRSRPVAQAGRAGFRSQRPHRTCINALTGGVFCRRDGADPTVPAPRNNRAAPNRLDGVLGVVQSVSSRGPQMLTKPALGLAALLV